MVSTRFVAKPRASALCNTGCAVYNLYRGFDTIHLTYIGTTRAAISRSFDMLKSLASEKRDLDTCVIEICGQSFSVLGFGSRRFAYALKNDFFYITVSRPDSCLPCVQVQISSEACLRLTPEAACKLSDEIASHIAVVEDSHVSRADICHDFSGPMDFESMTRKNFVSTCRKIHRIDGGMRFESLFTPRSSRVAVRLYDKTKEICVSDKPHWLQVWSANGYIPGSRVYRAEFELGRLFLRDFGLRTWADVLAAESRLWGHLTKKWFRISLQSDYSEDSNNRRWDVHPVWAGLSNVYDDSRPLERVDISVSERASDYRFRTGFSAILAHMADKKISSVQDGLRSFFEAAEQYHEGYEGLVLYLSSKYKEKLHQYAKKRRVNSWFVPGASYVDSGFNADFDDLESIPY